MGTNPRRFTEKQMRRYFTQRHRFSWKQITFVIVAILASIILIPVNSQLALVSLFLSLMLGAWVCWQIKSTPTNRQFDEWLENERQRLERHGYNQVLRQGRMQRIINTYTISGFILPYSNACKHYSGRKVFIKPRKKTSTDVYRFSFNVFTFFYITDHYLGVFVYGVDALDHDYLYAREDMAYSYAHITNVATRDGFGQVKINGQTHSYQARSFILQTINQEIKLGAYIGTAPIGDGEGSQVPKIYIDINYELQELRYAIRSRWR